ncbi:Spy/CpxP family protein refolding chaperone [Tellurirhabdus bombi]|uniref:Spy/CpxP family protein refolding chaperone n=1 Tax=Tellurirhabdus bombi TaxID=2907205 RepID=UPI001F4342F7|nr:Spy/CpxP family protein refolding chaperone [Tellurirhabdus bombi]
MWPRFNRSHQPHSFLTEKLDFTQEQQKEYKRLKEAHFKQIRPMMDKMQRDKQAFFGQVGKTTVSDSALLKQARKIEEQIAQVDVRTYRHFEKISALCTPEQRKKLQQVLKERRTRWARRGHGPGQKPDQ